MSLSSESTSLSDVNDLIVPGPQHDVKPPSVGVEYIRHVVRVAAEVQILSARLRRPQFFPEIATVCWV